VHNDGSRYRIENADGLDIRSGCHDILIDHVTGFTEDDTIALNLLGGTDEENFVLEGRTRDIYNIHVQNVTTATLCAIIRVLNLTQFSIYNVTLDHIFDATPESPSIDLSHHTVRIDCTPHFSPDGSTGGIRNLYVNDLRSASMYAVRMTGPCENITIDNVMLTAPHTIPLVNRAFGKNIVFRPRFETQPKCLPAATPRVADGQLTMKNMVLYSRAKNLGDRTLIDEDLSYQKRRMEEYCSQNGLSTVKYVCDADGSLAEFEKLVNSESSFDGVLVQDSRRITEDFLAYFTYQSKLFYNGMELVSVDGDFGFDN